MKLNQLNPEDMIIIDGINYAISVEDFIKLASEKKEKIWLAEKEDIEVDTDDVFNFIGNHLEMRNIETDEISVRDSFCDADLEEIASLINSKMKDIAVYVTGEEIEDDRSKQ